MSEYEFYYALGGFVSGLAGGSLLTFKFSNTKNARNNSIMTDQSSSHAGGDIVGRDKLNTRDIHQ